MPGKKLIYAIIMFFIAELPLYADQPILQSPDSLVQENHEIRAGLMDIIAAGGQTGAAAQNLANLVFPHLQNQLEFVFPPLGLLQLVTTGNVTPDMKAALPLIQKVKENYSEILSLHIAIIAQADNLVTIARQEKKQEAIDLANRIRFYAKSEEEVIFPTDILLGEFIKLKLNIKDN